MSSRYLPYALVAARDSSAAVKGLKIAISGTGANTALPVFSSGKQARVVLFTATVPCLVQFGVSGSSTVSTTVHEFYCAGNASYILQITDSAKTHIDIVAEPSASGSAYVDPLQWVTN